MLPVYKPGDHVVTFNWKRIAVGDVVVFKTTRSRLALAPVRKGLERFYIKRVISTRNKMVYVAGDNWRESAKMPPISNLDLIGKVIGKY